MPTSLPLERHLTVLDVAGATLADRAAGALDAPVPTCPAWDGAKLVAHQTMVHRWAAGNLTGEPFARQQTQIHDEEPDVVGYYRDGLAHLLATLRGVPDDVKAMVFLKDAPPPRRFWARRQAHETTIHGVDALAASLGRVPTADECADVLPIDADLAVDGIDELVGGFLPRGRPKIGADAPFVVVVDPTDRDVAWTLRVAPDRLVTELGAGGGDDAVTLSGTAVALYLGLWNRGDEFASAGPGDVLDRWRRLQRVTWS